VPVEFRFQCSKKMVQHASWQLGSHQVLCAAGCAPNHPELPGRLAAKIRNGEPCQNRFVARLPTGTGLSCRRACSWTRTCVIVPSTSFRTAAHLFTGLLCRADAHATGQVPKPSGLVIEAAHWLRCACSQIARPYQLSCCTLNCSSWKALDLFHLLTGSAVWCRCSRRTRTCVLYL
jgi:hypothetical protein